MANRFLNGLLADERRGMYNPPVISSSQINNTAEKHKYERLMDAQSQNVRENIGIIYNDDSLGQLESGPIPAQISHLGGANLEQQEKYIVINSADRDWYNRPLDLEQENPYKFRVQLGSINTRMVGGDSVNTDISVNNSLENVLRLECTNIIIPNREFSNGYRASNRPYMLVNVDRASDTVSGSNKSLDAALAVLTPKLPLPEALGNIRYLEHVNINRMGKDFLTPEARLSRLDITITRQDGVSPLLDTPSYDIISISTVYYIPGDHFLYLITNGYFNGNDFQVGDIFRVKGYLFRETNLGYVECNYFNQFINRESGHIIQGIAAVMGYTGPMFNILKFNCPGAFSPVLGDFAAPQWFSDLITKTNIEDSTQLDNTGKLINLNLQTNIFIKANCFIKSPLKLMRNIKPAS